MSLSTTTNRSDRTLNGVATVFAFDFKVFAETDLEVIHIDQTTEVETVLALGVDYTVSGVNADAGSVTLVAGPGTSGDRLIIKRVMNLVQPTRLRNQGDFFPATHERAFDRSIMIDQQQQEEIDRSFKLSPSATAGSVEAPSAEPGYALGWDSLGNLTNVPNTGADQTLAWTAADAVVAADAAAATALVRSDLAATTGAGLVGYLAPYTGAAAITVKARLDLVSDIRPATANGDNTFVGAAGNLTLSPSGGAATLASQNTGMGKGALTSLTTGFENTAVGVAAMSLTTTGNRNTAFGVTALQNNTIGDHNIAFGQNALQANVSGTYNTALGIDALHYTTDGYYNVALGQNALLNCLHGYYNTALGIDALKALTDGYTNVAVGNGAGYKITTGFYNCAIGNGALHECLNHVANTAVGQWAGYSNDGNYNVFIGYSAGYYETGSNVLMIDNAARASEADARTKALIYGLFSTTAAAQRLTFNANLGFNGLTRKLAKVFADNAGGAAYSFPADTSYVYLTSPNTTATTITLPATNGSNPIDGAEITFVCGSTITTTTWAAGAGGATITGNPTVTANVPVRWIYHAAGGKWYPA